MDYAYRDIERIRPRGGGLGVDELTRLPACPYCSVQLFTGFDEYSLGGGGAEREELIYSLCPKCGWWDLNSGDIYDHGEDPLWTYYQANLRRLPESDALSKFVIAELTRDLDRIFELAPHDFESFVCGLMNSVTDCRLELTKRTRDGGVDLLGFDTSGGPVAVEVKRYGAHRPISVSIVRSFVGALVAHDTHRGYVVSSSRFTRDAQQYALSLSQGGTYRLELRDIEDIRSWLGVAYDSEFDIEHIKQAINATIGKLPYGQERAFEGFPRPVAIRYPAIER